MVSHTLWTLSHTFVLAGIQQAQFVHLYNAVCIRVHVIAPVSGPGLLGILLLPSALYLHDCKHYVALVLFQCLHNQHSS